MKKQLTFFLIFGLLFSSYILNILSETTDLILDDEDQEFEEEEEEEEAHIYHGSHQIENSGGHHRFADFDEEEFEGYEQESHIPVASTTPAASKPATAAAADGEKLYLIELCFILVFLAYCVNFLLGRRYNEKLVYGWYRSIQPLLVAQFAHLGPLPEGTQRVEISSEEQNSRLSPAQVIEKVSQSDFRTFATGRRNCLGLQLGVKTLKRHDLVSIVLDLFRTSEDHVVFEIPLDSLEPFVFLYARNALLKQLTTSFKEIAPLTRPLSGQQAKNFPLGFSAASDAPDSAAQLLNDPRISRVIHDFKDEIRYIYLTDRATPARYAKMLRVSLKLRPEHLPAHDTLFQMIFFLIDYASQFKISPVDRAIQSKLRTQAHSKEQEELRTERLEKLKAAKLEEEKKRYSQMSPEQREKYDLKQQRKEQKKRQGRMKMIIKA